MANALDTLASDYPTVISLPILWGDMDAFQHVNNTASIRWFESSRIRLFEHPTFSGVLKTRHLAPILASVTCHYRRQLRYPDTIHVGCKVSKVGNTSLTVHHTLVSEQQDGIASDGHSAIVCFDYATERPVRIPDDLREAIRQMQGVR